MANKHGKKQVVKTAAQKTNTPKTKPKEQQAVETKKMFSVNRKLALLLGIISCVVYANTLKNGFVLDDYSVITDNTIVTKGISAIPELLTTPHMRGFFITAHDIYRPLSLVMFAVEYQFFGKSPMPYHLMNVLLFASCVILLFLFLDKLFERKKTAVAFLASLLFALHPVHTEVVANIKSRDELLCFFFAFLSLNIFIKYVESGKFYQLLLGASCFFLSIISKENAITFLAFIPLVFFWYRNESKTRSAYITVFIGVAAIVFLVIKFEVLSFYHANESTYIGFIDNALAKPDLAFSRRIATAILIMGYYLKLLFIPYPLISDYSYNSIPFVNFGNVGVLVSMAVYIFLIGYSIYRFRKNSKDPFALGIFYYLVTMSLFTNILFLLGSTLGERLLFFPSLSFCLIAALLLEKWIGLSQKPILTALKNPKMLAVIIPVCIVYSVIAINRNGEWLNNYTLYSADIKKSPDDCKLYCELGNELSKNNYAAEPDTAKQRQIIAESIRLLKKAIQIYPDYEEANTALGATYFRSSEYDSSEVYEKRTLALNARNTLALNNLAAVYFIKKKYREAIGMYKDIIEIRPDFINPYANIGLCYQYAGMYDSSIYYLEKAIEIDPGFKVSYEILATSYRNAGKLDLARKYEAIAKKNNPGFKL